MPRKSSLCSCLSLGIGGPFVGASMRGRYSGWPLLAWWSVRAGRRHWRGHRGLRFRAMVFGLAWERVRWIESWGGSGLEKEIVGERWADMWR